VTGPNDRRPEVYPSDELDASIERLLRGALVGDDVEHLGSVVDDLRALAGGPSPRPSSDLAHLLGDGVVTTRRPKLVSLGFRPRARHRWQRVGARVTAQVAGLGLATKVGLGLALAGAGAAGAGAAGVIPRSAVDAVRHTIEVVTPFEFAEGHSTPAGTDDQGRRSGADGRPDAETAADNQPASTVHAPDPRARTGESPGDNASPTLAPVVQTEQSLPAETAMPSQVTIGQDSNPSGAHPPATPSASPNHPPANSLESDGPPPSPGTDHLSTGHDDSPGSGSASMGRDRPAGWSASTGHDRSAGSGSASTGRDRSAGSGSASTGHDDSPGSGSAPTGAAQSHGPAAPEGPGDPLAVDAHSNGRPERPDPCGDRCGEDPGRAGSRSPPSGHQNGGSAPAQHGSPASVAPDQSGSPPRAGGVTTAVGVR
jgi:hypothetical protein